MKLNRPIQVFACLINLLHPVETVVAEQVELRTKKPEKQELHWVDKRFKETSPRWVDFKEVSTCG